MKFSNAKLSLLFILTACCARPAIQPEGAGINTDASPSARSLLAGRAPAFKTVLAEAGLQYSAAIPFAVSKDYRRGSWQGASPAFWTLAAAAGPVRLRLELTKNISRALAEKTMAERFVRIDALYSGAAAYPGMVTTEVEVPPQLRPTDLRTGAGERKIKMLAATAGMAYGAGAEDLISHRGLLGYIYCEPAALLAQIELFFPKAEFNQAGALREFDALGCTLLASDYGAATSVIKE